MTEHHAMINTNGFEEQSLTESIRYLEEISLNAWPSHKIELYDGWLIRFSHNYTYRTNAVEQVGKSTLPVQEKIAYCESVYRDLGSPCHFKINPLTDPGFDALLSDRDYQIRHVTQTMTADLDKLSLMQTVASEYEFENRLGMPSCVHMSAEDGTCVDVRLQSIITDEWIHGLFHLNGTCEPILRRIVPSMFKAIPKKTIAASVEIDGRMVASGLGICDRQFVGLYAVYVSPGCRRRHYARAVCSAILSEGARQGASRSYLQVVQGNQTALSLYASLGFMPFFTYWFRSRADL